LGSPLTGDNCAVANVVNDAPTTYAAGTNAVIWTVTDTHGNSRSCTQTVVVVDTQRPAPSCPGPITVSTAPGQCASNVTFTATFTDNCSGGSILCVPPSGFSFLKGTTNVICTATDAAGNSSNCSFAVTVNDTERPVPSCPGNLTVSTAPGQCASNVSFLATFTDNCGGGSIVCVPASGSSFPKGTTNVVCTATDAPGKSASAWLR